MKRIEYKNNNGDVFTFSKTYDENILMEGDFELLGVGYSIEPITGENVLVLITPYGGPYLESGHDMGVIDSHFSGMVINQFKKLGKDFLILTSKKKINS